MLLKQLEKHVKNVYDSLGGNKEGKGGSKGGKEKEEGRRKKESALLQNSKMCIL